MDDASYLMSRGWVFVPGGAGAWSDPLVDRCSMSQALVIQRARDAAEERKAWVQFAAAGSLRTGNQPEEAVERADALLEAYRARFALPATTKENDHGR